jgi:hypothetical protein
LGGLGGDPPSPPGKNNTTGGDIKLCFFFLQVLVTFWEQIFFVWKKYLKKNFPKNFFVPKSDQKLVGGNDLLFLLLSLLFVFFLLLSEAT